MIGLAIGFALGCMWLQQQASLPAAGTVIGAAISGLVAAVAALAVTPQTTVVAGRRFMAGALWLLAGLCLAAAWAAWRAQQRMDDALPTALEGRDVIVEGFVATLPQPHERGVRFGFEVSATPHSVPRRLMLTWYSPAPADGEPAVLPEVHAGERWRMVVRLRRVHGNANPHGFDYEAWMLESHWRASGYVRPAGAVRMEAAADAPARDLVERLRENIRARFDATLGSDAPWRAVMTALAIGDQGSISAAQWRLFAATGITHLISISGLHVTMLAALAYGLIGAAWRFAARRAGRRVRWFERLPRPLVASAGAALTACAYAALAGFAVPAQRTLYMLGAAALALAWRREMAAAQVLCIALLVVLLVDPWAVLAAGFWLSFGAVAVLLYAIRGSDAQGARQRALQWLRTQWAVTLGSVPLLLALFQQVSLVSPFANVLAIPLVSMIVTPLTLAAVVPGLEWLLQPAHGLFAAASGGLECLAALPFAQWRQAAAPPWHVALALGGCVLLLMPTGLRIRWLGWIGFLPLLTFVPPRPVDGEAWVRILDVGQGLAVHVQTAQHDLVFDAGPAFSDETDAGTRILVPYLRALGVPQVDTLIISHADRDHAGGALSLAREVPVASLRHSLPEDDAVLLALRGDVPDRPVTRCRAGERWSWDGVAFEELHPFGDNANGKDNAMSCVLRVAAGPRALLIASDIEAAQEAALLAAGSPLAADVLLVPHHGSKTSSTPAFVAATQARHAVFAVGYRNRFGHPRADVVNRYEAMGASVHRTDRDGAVAFVLNAGTSPSPVGERSVRRRYWHGG